MTKTIVFPPMPVVSRSVAIVPLTYPLTKAGVATVLPPMPVVSRSMATVPLTNPLTRAGVVIVFPPSPLTTASGSLTESTVHDSTRPHPDDRQDGT